MNKKVNWKLIINLLTMLVPIGIIIYFLFSEKGLFDLIENASKLNGWWVFIGIAYYFANILIDAIVLYIIANSYDKNYISSCLILVLSVN